MTVETQTEGQNQHHTNSGRPRYPAEPDRRPAVVAGPRRQQKKAIATGRGRNNQRRAKQKKTGVANR
jgi:hypothetical protein